MGILNIISGFRDGENIESHRFSIAIYLFIQPMFIECLHDDMLFKQNIKKKKINTKCPLLSYISRFSFLFPFFYLHSQQEVSWTDESE